MDIYQRTLCCNVDIDDLKSDEIEVLEAETPEGTLCEEEELEEEEKLDVKQMSLELECMKRRIQKMQLKLKMMDMAECPEEECVDFEVELTCSENKEICALQKAHHKLQCQINELIRCCLFAKEQIRDLRIRMCEVTKEIEALKKAVCILNAWKMTLEHEFGKCLERFEFLKHVKAEWADVEAMIDKQKKCYADLEKTFVSKRCYVFDKKCFIAEFSELKDLFKEFYDLQKQRMISFEQRLNNMVVVVPVISSPAHLIRDQPGVQQQQQQQQQLSKSEAEAKSIKSEKSEGWRGN